MVRRKPILGAKKRGRPAADGIAVDHCWICEAPHQRSQHARYYRKALALWVACGRPMQDVSGIERPDMEAARAIQTKRAKQKCRTCGKNHFPFCKPSGKRTSHALQISILCSSSFCATGRKVTSGRKLRPPSFRHPLTLPELINNL